MFGGSAAFPHLDELRLFMLPQMPQAGIHLGRSEPISAMCICAISAFLRVFLLCAAFGVCRAAPPPAPFTLPNGLRIVLRERHAGPLVAIDLWVRAGAREEREQESGSAHFLEHTLFKGTTTRGPGETDIAIENLGATLSAATGPDYAHFYTTVAAVHLEEALAVLADIMQNATLPDAEIERERGVILDELAKRASDPINTLIDALYARAFTQHPYRHAPGGTPEAIRLRGRDTLAAFYRRAYAPERCVLALAGDLTPEQAETTGKRALGNWTSPRADTDRDVTLSEPEQDGPRSYSLRAETSQP
jgi:zinc protease